MIDINLNYELKCGYPVINIEHHKDDERLLVIYRKSVKGSPISTCFVDLDGEASDESYSLVAVKKKVTKYFCAYKSSDGFKLSQGFDRKKQAEEFHENGIEVIKVFGKSFEL